MADRTRANYALVDINEHVGENRTELDVPWAAFVGDRSSSFTVSIPAETTLEPYVGVQAFDVGTYGHEIYVNDDPLSGFDLPPADGWQYWIDRITGAALEEGDNTVRIERDTDTDDGFVVGTLGIHWKEPIE